MQPNDCKPLQVAPLGGSAHSHAAAGLRASRNSSKGNASILYYTGYDLSTINDSSSLCEDEFDY